MKSGKVIKQILIVFLSIQMLQPAFCQENYLPATTIGLNGDSTKGYIDYQNWKRNPEQIYFKHKTDSIKFTLTAHDIAGFKVSDEIYVSAMVKTEISPDRTDMLSYFSELLIQPDTVFLQAKVQGDRSLYFLENKTGKGQFYIKTDTAFELLIYKKYLKKQNGNNIIIENNLFKGQLAIYLQDCPEIRKLINNTKYTQQSLEKLFGYYYSCTQSATDFIKPTEKTATEFGILAGVSLTSIRIRTSNNYYSHLVKTDYGISPYVSAGLFFSIVLPRNRRKFSIYNELIYTSYNLEGQYTSSKNVTIDTRFGYSYIKMNNLLRYSYPEGKVFVFFNGGFSNGIAINEINVKKVNGAEVSKALEITRKHEQGLLLGGGIKTNRFSYEIRFERGNGISNKVTTSTITNRFFFIVGYRI